MKISEIRFIPRIDRSRDLVYSEYSSSGRCLHLLLQDDSIEQYKFLLSAYREIIERYLSTRSIETPTGFFAAVLEGLEVLLNDQGLILDDLRNMGFYLLLTEREHLYLLTSAEDRVHVGEDANFTSLASAKSEEIEVIEMPREAVQQELFPRRLGDVFTLHRITVSPRGSLELILGCMGEGMAQVFGAIRDTGAQGEQGLGAEVPLEFLSQKVLFLRCEAQVDSMMSRTLRKDKETTARTAFGRVHSAAVLATAIVVLIVGTLWIGRRFWKDTFSASKLPASLADSTSPPEPTPAGNPDHEQAGSGTRKAEASRTVRFSTAWKKTYRKPVTSSPILKGQQVFFGCRDGKLYALDRDTGKLLWSYEASDGIGASPAISEERIICADYRGSVFALELEAGKRLWLRSLPGRIVSSPCCTAGRIVVGCYDGSAYCLSLETGRILWRRKTGGRIRGSIAASSGLFFIPSYDGNLYAVSVETGAIRWVYKTGGEVISSPATTDRYVVIGGADGNVRAIEVESGALGWTFKAGGPVKSSVLAAGGRIYVGSNDGCLYCLEDSEGSLVWKYKTEGILLSRPNVTNGLVFFGSYDDNFYCLDAGTGAALDRFSTSGRIFSSPAADGNRVFFGNNTGEFFCLTYADEETS